MRSQYQPSFIDLFSGCGGLSLGFIQAGFRCLLAADIDPSAIHCYNFNLKGACDRGAIQVDLGALTSTDAVYSFLEEHGIEAQSCDVLIGGPPCQSFSVVGRNKIRALMESDNNLKLYWENKNQERAMLVEVYALFLKVIAPRWFIFENVPTIRSHDSFAFIIHCFNKIVTGNGLSIQYKLIPDNYLASKYGVPQDRRRFILVGYRADLGIESWHPPREKTTVTVSDALDDLPWVPHGHRERIVRYSAQPATGYQQLMRRDLPEDLRGYLFDHICRWHNQDDVALFGVMRPGAKFADIEVQKAIQEINPQHNLLKYSTDKFKDKLHKLVPERPAWTVTAHLQKDCYKFIHYNQPRTITVREAARLQSFPDHFRFDGLSMVTSFRLIGNAVPPLLAQAFAESFLEADRCLSVPR